MSGDEDPPAPSAGADLVREALDRARADGAARRAEAGRAATGAASAEARRRRRSGAPGVHRAGGDPVAFGVALEGLVADRGWERDVAGGSVLGSWAELVGEEIARRATPTTLVDGVLTVQAESTAWATQLRLLAPQLLTRLNADGGPEVVRRLVVRGPTGPTWRHGARSVKGEGPRDTYG